MGQIARERDRIDLPFRAKSRRHCHQLANPLGAGICFRLGRVAIPGQPPGVPKPGRMVAKVAQAIVERLERTLGPGWQPTGKPSQHRAANDRGRDRQRPTPEPWRPAIVAEIGGVHPEIVFVRKVLRIEREIVPFRLAHQMIDVVADQIERRSPPGQDLRVAVGDVRNVSDVERARPGWRGAPSLHDRRHGRDGDTRYQSMVRLRPSSSGTVGS